MAGTSESSAVSTTTAMPPAAPAPARRPAGPTRSAGRWIEAAHCGISAGVKVASAFTANQAASSAIAFPALARAQSASAKMLEAKR